MSLTTNQFVNASSRRRFYGDDLLRLQNRLSAQRSWFHVLKVTTQLNSVSVQITQANVQLTDVVMPPSGEFSIVCGVKVLY